jgi:hypothetical protein
MAQRVSDQRFAASKHRYTDPRTGERYIGVTSVVGSFDTGDKLGAGAGAAVKLVKQGIDYRAEWNEKKNLGNRVHGYAQLWIEGRSADVLDSDAPQMNAFRQFINDYKPEWIEVERAVVSSLGYGGRFDAIAYFDGCFWLLDFKTGKPYKFELMLQLAAYRYMDGMIVYDEEGWAKDLEPMPVVDKCAGLYLTADGYQLVEVDADEDALVLFNHLLAVKNGYSRMEKSL